MAGDPAFPRPYLISPSALLSGFVVLLFLGLAVLVAQDPEAEAPPQPEDLSEDTPSSTETPKQEESEQEPEEEISEIVRRAPEMTTPQLVDLMVINERLNRAEVVKQLAEIILNREPENVRAKDALRRAELGAKPVEETGSDPGLAGPEVVALRQVEAARKAGKYKEVATILAQLKRDQFQAKSFPYQQDLAEALVSMGALSTAIRTFQEIVTDLDRPRSVREAARKRISDVEESRLAKLVDEAVKSGNYDAALRMSTRLIEVESDNDAVIGMHADLLLKSGRQREAIAYLETVRPRYAGMPFPFQQTLAYAILETDGMEAAIAPFQQLAAEASYPADQRRDARERLKEFEEQQLLKRAREALAGGNLREANTLSLRALSAPNPPDDAFEFRAEVLSRQGRQAEAVELLERYRAARHPGDAPFPAQGALAYAYYAVGDWPKAQTAYEKLLDTGSISPEERNSALETLDEISQVVGGSIRFGVDGFTEEEGTLWRAQVEAQLPVVNGNQFGVVASWIDISLSDGRIVTFEDATKWEAEVWYRRYFKNGFYAGASIGGTEDEALGSLTFGRDGGSESGRWSLELAFNERAEDSLHLEALDGRQHAVHLRFEKPFRKDWHLEAHLAVRDVRLDGASLGTGFSADWNLSKTVLSETAHRPEVRIGYAGEFSQFDHDRIDSNLAAEIVGPNNLGSISPGEIGEYLIEETIHRHSIELGISKDFSPKLAAYVIAGVGYEVEDEAVEYRVAAGIEYKLNERATLTAGVDYDSSGTASSEGEGVVYGTVGMRVRF